MADTVGQAIRLLQRYPVPLLLPTVLVVTAGIIINSGLYALRLGEFGNFLIAIVGICVNFGLICCAFLCVANYVGRNDATGERPEIKNLLSSFRYPNCEKVLAGVFVRFLFTLPVAWAFAVFIGEFVLGGFKGAHHTIPKPFSARIYLWLAFTIGVLVLSRWMLVIPLFAQGEGQLRSPFRAGVEAIKGRRTFAIAFSLLVIAVCYPFQRWTLLLHPHLSEGAARYVPHFLEFLAVHGFLAVAWTYWMIVITLLAMRLQRHDEPISAAPLAIA
jgi:hypothetical protein